MVKASGWHSWKDGGLLFKGDCENGLYVLRVNPLSEISDAAHATKQQDFWNERLYHENLQSLRGLQKSEAVQGLDGSTQNENCSSCHAAKQCKYLVHSSKHRSKNVGAVIHSDLCGKMPIVSLGGSVYFVTFIYEASHYVTVQPININSDVKDVFIKYQSSFESKFS